MFILGLALRLGQARGPSAWPHGQLYPFIYYYLGLG